MLSHCEIRLPVGGWPKHTHRHIRGLQLLGIYLEFSSAPPGSGGGSVRYAGEAANAPRGREEEVAESDTTTWSQWGYRRLMIKAKGSVWRKHTERPELEILASQKNYTEALQLKKVDAEFWFFWMNIHSWVTKNCQTEQKVCISEHSINKWITWHKQVNWYR